MAENENKATPEFESLEEIMKRLDQKIQAMEDKMEAAAAASTTEAAQEAQPEKAAEEVLREESAEEESRKENPTKELLDKFVRKIKPAAREGQTEEKTDSTESSSGRPIGRRPRKAASADEEQTLSWQETVMVYLHDIIYLLAALIIVFVLLFRIVVVSGSSMYSTLWDGDSLLVLSSVFYHEPQYGDIIVASKDSFNDGEPIIKRVIATEGQTVDIDFETGIVYVDGVALEEDYTYTPTTVSEGVEFPLTVDEGCVFAMGDNRDRSRDSRYPDIGLIDEREILGRAVYLFFPGAGENDAPRDFSRIGVLN